MPAEKGFFDYFINLFWRHQFGVSYIITDCLFSYFLMVLFMEKKKNPWHYLFYIIDFIAIEATSIFLCSMFSYFFDNFLQDNFSTSIVLPFIIVVYSLIRSCKNKLTIAIYDFVFYASCISSLIISEFIGEYLRVHVFTVNGPFTVIIQALLISSCVFYLKWMKIEKNRAFSNVVSSIAVLTVSALHIFAYYMINRSVREYKGINALINFIFIILEYLSIYLYYNVAKEHKERMLLQAKVLHEERDIIMMDMAKADETKYKKIRHDMKNHIAFMKVLLDEGKYDELKQYFSEYSSEIYDAVQFAKCGNDTIDYILRIEQESANKNKIKLDYHIGVAPKMAISDNDLCSLLCNLIDNAIEATSKSDVNPKTIGININQNDNVLLVRISNPIDPKLNGVVDVHHSSKANAKAHGFGVRNIREICDKYDGAFNHKAENNCFIADCMLLLKEDEIHEENN